MIIYNTTFHIENDILTEGIDYLKQEFIPSSIRSGILSSPVLHRVLQEAEEGTSLCVQFRVKDRQALQDWICKEGTAIQQELVKRFGYQMTGFSTLLEEIEL